MKISTTFIWLGTILIAGSVFAQDGLRGHWSGAIELPDQQLAAEIDLDKTDQGWIGSISIPAQNATGIPLDGISFQDGKCTFRIKGGPGQPTFNGTLGADGKSIAGDFTQGGGSFPFKLKRTGDAKVEVIKSSPPLAKEFLGTWEGTLGGQPLRLKLTMSNEDGGAKAVMISLDQGDAVIPVSGIGQKESKLTLTVNAVGGSYVADLNKDATELSGTWSQGGNDLPLKLKKAGAAAPNP